MPHSQTVEALVLKTYDIGEADRFCILLTRERGRLAVRAKGVRKPLSRMGGSLSAFGHVRMEIKESSGGWIAAGVRSMASDDNGQSLMAFTACAEGSELLLRLLQDDEAVNGVFETTLSFFAACKTGVPHVSLAFSIRLLHLLGLLPADEDMHLADDFSLEEQTFLQAARTGYFLREHVLISPQKLQRMVDKIVQGQITSPLKAPGVAAALQKKS